MNNIELSDISLYPVGASKISQAYVAANSTTEVVNNIIDEVNSKMPLSGGMLVGNIGISGDLSVDHGKLVLHNDSRFIVDGSDLELYDSNYKQTSIRLSSNGSETVELRERVYNLSPHNSFVQAEEAYRGDDVATSYGVACAGYRGFCILQTDSAMHTIKLSGAPETVSNDIGFTIGKCGQGRGYWSIMYSGGETQDQNGIAVVSVLYGDLSSCTVSVDPGDSIPSVTSEEEAVRLWKNGDENAFYFVPDVSKKYGGKFGYAFEGDEIISGYFGNTRDRVTVLGNADIMAFNGTHVEGGSSKALGKYSHAEGRGSVAEGRYSHAEGSFSHARNIYSHVEGNSTFANGSASHAEGASTNASSSQAHAEGNTTHAVGVASHAEGQGSAVDQNCSLSQLDPSNFKRYASSKRLPQLKAHDILKVNNSYRHVVDVISSSESSTTFDVDTSLSSANLQNAVVSLATGVAYGSQAHAEGVSSKAIGTQSHSEGNSTTAVGNGSHAEGNATVAAGNYSHTEGSNTKALSAYAHAEGNLTIASGNGAHAEGNAVSAVGNYSHAEGYQTYAGYIYSHAAGYNAKSNHTRAFTWSGVESASPYASTKAGTFNINPVDEISGFYIGSKSLAQWMYTSESQTKTTIKQHLSSIFLSSDGSAVKREDLSLEDIADALSAIFIACNS